MEKKKRERENSSFKKLILVFIRLQRRQHKEKKKISHNIPNKLHTLNQFFGGLKTLFETILLQIFRIFTTNYRVLNVIVGSRSFKTRD